MNNQYYRNGELLTMTDAEQADWLASQPTQDDLDREAQEEANTQYQRDREEEYPPLADYLDGIVKGDTAQVDQYIADCLAVKTKYPKP